MANSETSLLRPAIQGAVVSLLASAVKAKSEPPLQHFFEDLFPPTPAQKELVGADPAGHPDNMPPAVIAEKFAETALGTTLDKHQKLEAQQVIHYTFGMALGAAYGIATARHPALTKGLGIPAGLTLYACTHASTLPLLGIQKPFWRLPLSAVCWEATSHVIFGATMTLGLRLLRR
ncbi:DUF1440 domain-containing protein [Nocardia sp. NPDC058666]|uniref:DUF1440 domain-containing protein n=1 Tax=Nocardia sp. NPDC058666 TaxID=3346587 RepID=UPI003651B902